MRNVTLFVLALAVPALAQNPKPANPPESIGIVLTGGGSFGAFEIGAIQAFYARWKAEHGEDPPVSVIAGTSTGALLAPFVALGPPGIQDAADLYRNVKQSDILTPKTSDMLPFFLFTLFSPSAYSADGLKHRIAAELPEARLKQIAGMWPGRRVAVLATNFATGRPAPFTNAPEDIGRDPAAFRDGVLASAISPLATPPVYIKTDAAHPADPYLDGGVHAVTPFQAFFDLAAHAPEVDLTQVIVFSAYPVFPSDDSAPVQKEPFPKQPQFGAIGARMDALISESSISKEVALAWAAIELRRAGVSAEKVKERTGLYIPKPPRELILVAPDTRLGWDNLKFDPAQMRQMFDRGVKATPRKLD